MPSLYWIRRIMVSLAVFAATVEGGLAASPENHLRSEDLYRFRSVNEVEIAPDNSKIAYTVETFNPPGRPSFQTWAMEIRTGKVTRIDGEMDSSSYPRWSPDGQWIAFFGHSKGRDALVIVRPDGSQPTTLAPVEDTNGPVPSPGERISWSPDSKRIAFVSATPGPETVEATGDPIVIRRYLYKPNWLEGSTRFNDNRRLHVFVVDLASKRVRQLTRGSYYEHSIDWCPVSNEILFVSNHGSDPDRIFNYDIFEVNADDARIKQLTQTEAVEYSPRWSPDGKRIAFQGTNRKLTSSETTMEDTHVWVMSADGSQRQEIGKDLDDRQGPPKWGSEGNALWACVEVRGNVVLYRFPLGGGKPEPAVHERGIILGWSIGSDGSIVYSLHSPGDLGELFIKTPGIFRQLTTLNTEVLKNKSISPVESFTFRSFDGTEIESFLTKPPDTAGIKTHPLIVTIHGGPHGQQGPEFDLQTQIYAAKGWSSLMVNYRGSTGYGQKFADAIFHDQDGGEARDVMSGVQAALASNEWIDPDRLGVEGVSYGGQLTDWIITQTPEFKAAIATAGISNLISFNYMAYYHDYLATEFGEYPHEDDLMNFLWERSALKHVVNVKTPTMLVHGENDNDVPIAEAEQYYIALKDVGVETVFIRYPREGHGVHETKHVVDFIDRSADWYTRHFAVAELPSN